MCFDVALSKKIIFWTSLGQVRLDNIRSINATLIVKTNPRFGECYTCFAYENETKVVRNLL